MFHKTDCPEPEWNQIIVEKAEDSKRGAQGLGWRRGEGDEPKTWKKTSVV